MNLIPIQDVLHKNMHILKKKEIVERKVGLQIAAFQQSVFPMLVETPYFGGVINVGGQQMWIKNSLVWILLTSADVDKGRGG